MGRVRSTNCHETVCRGFRKTYTADEITEETIADHLMTGFLPTELRDPELLIRTSGERV